MLKITSILPLNHISYIGLVESKVTDIFQHNNADDDDIESQFNTVLSDNNHVAHVLTEFNLILDENTLYNLMGAKCVLGKFQMALSSTISSDGKYIVDDNKISIDLSNNSDYSNNDDEGFIIGDIFKKSKDSAFDLDSIMVSTVHEGHIHGIKVTHLSKIWHIAEDTAKRTLEITTQRSIRKDNPKLSRNYGTNHRML